MAGKATDSNMAQMLAPKLSDIYTDDEQQCQNIFQFIYWQMTSTLPHSQALSEVRISNALITLSTLL